MNRSYKKAKKKAVHVKWDGKTIALGSYPPTEADEKCRLAKALTRAWRSTLRQQPNRQWVINELEKRQIRVVRSRLPKKESYVSDSDGGCGSCDISEDRFLKHYSSTDITAPLLRAKESIHHQNSLKVAVDKNVCRDEEKEIAFSPITKHRHLVRSSPIIAHEAINPESRALEIISQRSENFDQRVEDIDGDCNNISNNITEELYEMLKTHYSNLRDEIQETEIMMEQAKQQIQQEQLKSHSL